MAARRAWDCTARQLQPLVALVLVASLALAGGCQSREAEHYVITEELPGAPPIGDDLRSQMGRALARMGPDYRPRTHHLRADGTPVYMNRLILTASPYLLQHAHNPVDWYPWGDEAFERARSENRPVLLSVGYSTCHWCHVMEEESFEDVEIATYLNANYVAIKVDREERPDIDSTYMSAMQALTGSGGWPMTVWLTPERQPFFGGTYFPPRDGDRGASLGFLSLLKRMRSTYDAEPHDIAQRAAAVTAHVRQLAAPEPGDAPPGPEVLHAAFEQYVARFDSAHGGFGDAPKFPTPASLRFLLRYHRRSANPQALAMVTRTLEKMAAGGIYDHVGGGFHRYATDPGWQVPHFEKMLYDNAQLAAVYLEAYQLTKRRDFARVTRETLDYLGREMTAPAGGFYSATDADSEGEEGKFFVWTPAEIAAVLDADGTAAVTTYYAVTERGNFEGKNILHTPRPLATVAEELGTTPHQLRSTIDEARQLLYAARSRRVSPHRDTKILAAWNGLAIAAFARAGAVLGDQAYIERAQAAADFVLESMRVNGRLRRSHSEGGTHHDGFLEDYAFLAASLIDLYEATFQLRWLEEAIGLHATLARLFWDDQGSGFFMTASDREAPLAREKPDYDGALPSGNAIATENLLRLAEFTGDDRYRQRAVDTLKAFAPRLRRAPMRAPQLTGAVDFLIDRPKEIVIVRPKSGRDEEAAKLLAVVRETYLPNHVLTVAAEGTELAEQSRLIPLVLDKRALRGVATAYVCEQGVCELPTADVAVLARQLAKIHPLPEATIVPSSGSEDPPL